MREREREKKKQGTCKVVVATVHFIFSRCEVVITLAACSKTGHKTGEKRPLRFKKQSTFLRDYIRE